MLGLLVAIGALGVVGCGGKASREKGDVAAEGAGGAPSFGGAAGAGAPGAGAPEPTEPEPSSVSLSVSGIGGDTDAHAAAACMQGFHGFSAQAAGLSIEFEAFVFAPGQYEGDAVQILWLDARRADGEHYQAAAGTAESSGAILLNAEQVEPRFVGTLEALLPAVDDPTRPPLMLTLTFDIAPRAGCP